MLALEKGRVIVVWGSGAYYSVLSGRRHQGRTAEGAGEPLYRTALGGKCQHYYSTFQAYYSELLHMGRVSCTRLEVAGNVGDIWIGTLARMVKKSEAIEDAGYYGRSA
jgi:hypothetical protein